jgi:hypothetical protein
MSRRPADDPPSLKVDGLLGSVSVPRRLWRILEEDR